MTTKRLVFERLGPPVRSLVSPKTDRERVVEHLVAHYQMSQEEAEQRYACWDVIHNIRAQLGIKD